MTADASVRAVGAGVHTMPSPVPTRPAETRVVADFLASASVEPTALLVEGEAGIGKTTLWMAAVGEADARGFRLLSARPSAAESVLAYASLADMLGGVSPDVWLGLPDPQRLAIERVLLRTRSYGQATDQRAVAAAFLSVVRSLLSETPVLRGRRSAMARFVQRAGHRLCGAAARRACGRARYGSVRPGQCKRDIVAAAAEYGRNSSNSIRSVEHWWPGQGRFRTARPRSAAANHGAHTRGFPWQSV